MAENVTPEERLLKIIDSQGKPQAQFVLRDVRTWPAFLLQYGRRFAQGLKWPRQFGLKQINQILVGVLVSSVVMFIYDVNRSRPSVGQIKKPEAVSGTQGGGEVALGSLRSLSAYVEEAKKRDLFHPPVPPPGPQAESEKVEAAKVPPPSPLDILQKKTEMLKLVGTSFAPSDVDIPIAIIEDTSTQKTYFLKEGEFINGVQVVDVSEGKVILSYDEAEYELF